MDTCGATVKVVGRESQLMLLRRHSQATNWKAGLENKVCQSQGSQCRGSYGFAFRTWLVVVLAVS